MNNSHVSESFCTNCWKWMNLSGVAQKPSTVWANYNLWARLDSCFSIWSAKEKNEWNIAHWLCLAMIPQHSILYRSISIICGCLVHPPFTFSTPHEGGISLQSRKMSTAKCKVFNPFRDRRRLPQWTAYTLSGYRVHEMVKDAKSASAIRLSFAKSHYASENHQFVSPAARQFSELGKHSPGCFHIHLRT